MSWSSTPSGGTAVAWEDLFLDEGEREGPAPYQWATWHPSCRLYFTHPSRGHAIETLHRYQAKGLRGLLVRVSRRWSDICTEDEEPEAIACFASGRPIPRGGLHDARTGRKPITY